MSNKDLKKMTICSNSQVSVHFLCSPPCYILSFSKNGFLLLSLHVINKLGCYCWVPFGHCWLTIRLFFNFTFYLILQINLNKMQHFFSFICMLKLVTVEILNFDNFCHWPISISDCQTMCFLLKSDNLSALGVWGIVKWLITSFFYF